MNSFDLDKISKKSKIKTVDVLNIINLIKTKTPTVSELIKETNLSHGQIKSLLLSIAPVVNYSKSSPRLTITKKGEYLIPKQNDVKAGDFNRRDLEKFISYSKQLMPPPKREFDQFYATTETVVGRIEKFIEEKDLQNRRILFLGDDDLTSLATAYTFKAQEVAVLEIDAAILHVIEKMSKEQHLKINYRSWDLKKAIPKEFLHRFDTVFTDPPYTEDGFNLFLRRSLEATKENSLSSHYICYGTSSLSRERSLKIQKIIDQYGLFIREKIPGFNKYIKGAETVGNVSDLYMLEKTPQTKLGKTGSIKRLYTWE